MGPLEASGWGLAPGQYEAVHWPALKPTNLRSPRGGGAVRVSRLHRARLMCPLGITPSAPGQVTDPETPTAKPPTAASALWVMLSPGGWSVMRIELVKEEALLFSAPALLSRCGRTGLKPQPSSARLQMLLLIQFIGVAGNKKRSDPCLLSRCW